MSNTLKFGAGKWAAKAGSVLAYNDENNNFKPLPFTFTRASSATRVNESGLIESVASGIPRVDYLNNADGHLLLEPSRTNKITTSNDFSGAGWFPTNFTVTANQVISPDGELNASKFEALGDGSLRNTVEASFNDGYAYSIFVKKGNARYVTIRSAFFTQSISCGFDLDTLTAQTNGKIDDYGNDWYRLSIAKNISGDADRSGFFYLYLPNVFGQQNSGVGNYAYLYGGQIEDGSYATSYIPTSGSSVTRVADDNFILPPTGIIGQTEGSVFIDFNISNTESKLLIALDAAAASNFIILDINASLVPAIKVRQSSGSFPAIITGTAMSQGRNKIAFCYKAGDYAMYVNGVLAGTSTSTTFPAVTLTKLSVGTNASYDFIEDSINEVKLYNTRLSNSELAALTS